MKILIAIDSFKGSISSAKGSDAISKGIKDVYPQAEVLQAPLADGGEGTVEALVSATDGEFISKTVTGPLHENVKATYGIIDGGKTAVIEVATACGLTLIQDEEQNPSLATTYGVGELINDAISKGCREFIMGLGGSATNDAGVGMLQALGFRFLNRYGREVGFGGEVLKDIDKIDLSQVKPVLKECTFRIACDVNNPLYGVNGATHIYGPQKGATLKEIKKLDEGMEHFALFVYNELNINLQLIDGGGAAGGMGAAFAGFTNAYLNSGIELVLETIDLDSSIRGVDFVITGEGRLDSQTSMGKAPLGIAGLARKYKIPVIVVAGEVSGDVADLNEFGIHSSFSIINGPMSVKEAMDPIVTYKNLRYTTNQLFQLIRAVINIKAKK